jgi:exopolyphosphatase/guanosine-5'-triphosphate,3'-diphosphate pyrophosphatase
VTKRRVATFDIGTHTTNFLVADIEDGRLTSLRDALRFTRLGEGLRPGGPVTVDALARLDAALAELVSVADALDAECYVAGLTSAARDASNAGEVLATVARHGIDGRVLSGDEEADLTLAGVLSDGSRQSVSVIDIGGGSTEIICGRPGAVTYRASLQIGSVRLRDRHFTSSPPSPDAVARLRRDVRAALDAAAPPTPLPGPVIGVAGTVACLAGLAAGLERIEPERLEGASVGSVTVSRLARHLVTLTPDEVLALAPELLAGRASLLPSGATLLDVLMEGLAVGELRYSTRGLQHGLAMSAR